MAEEDITALKLQIEGMRAKLNEYKRFKAQYQASVRHAETVLLLGARINRENRKLRRAIDNVLNAASSEIVEDIQNYLTKVLTGLGYSE